MATQTISAPPAIHQKRVAIRSASRPAGDSDDWMPLQPESQPTQTRAASRLTVADTPIPAGDVDVSRTGGEGAGIAGAGIAGP